MRYITSHEVNLTNQRLEIRVVDPPGPGGASHHYEIYVLEPNASPKLIGEIKFQNGPIKEVGVNGLTMEVLLAIVADRLQSYQSGDFKCRENAVALTHIETAALWLQKRTMERVRRGVEGTMTV